MRTLNPIAALVIDSNTAERYGKQPLDWKLTLLPAGKVVTVGLVVDDTVPDAETYHLDLAWINDTVPQKANADGSYSIEVPYSNPGISVLAGLGKNDDDVQVYSGIGDGSMDTKRVDVLTKMAAPLLFDGDKLIGSEGNDIDASMALMPAPKKVAGENFFITTLGTDPSGDNTIIVPTDDIGTRLTGSITTDNTTADNYFALAGEDGTIIYGAKFEDMKKAKTPDDAKAYLVPLIETTKPIDRIAKPDVNGTTDYAISVHYTDGSYQMLKIADGNAKLIDVETPTDTVGQPIHGMMNCGPTKAFTGKPGEHYVAGVEEGDDSVTLNFAAIPKGLNIPQGTQASL